MFIDACERYRFISGEKGKPGEFKIGKMAFSVPARMASEITRNEEKRQARTASGEIVDLADFHGEAVFNANDIRVEQLGWLSLKRNVEYILVKEKEGLVAVGVK